MREKLRKIDKDKARYLLFYTILFAVSFFFCFQLYFSNYYKTYMFTYDALDNNYPFFTPLRSLCGICPSVTAEIS